MKRLLVLMAWLSVPGAIAFHLFSCGWFSPGRIPGNTRYPEMELRAERALKYAERKGMNDRYCLFLDYGIPSGKPRLFVWSFEEARVVYSGYAMHGPGKGSTDEMPVFSNVYGSRCSSVGRFEVTRKRGTRNKTGLRLKGLDRSNHSAWPRNHDPRLAVGGQEQMAQVHPAHRKVLSRLRDRLHAGYGLHQPFGGQRRGQPPPMVVLRRGMKTSPGAGLTPIPA